MPAAKRELTTADILSPEDYARLRDARRSAIMAAKKNRRVSVGPYATFYFENYDTMWLQVQEMLRTEKGGVEQAADELRAYNPLIPKGKELVATVMFEIEDLRRRQEVLSTLGGVERMIELRLGKDVIVGQPEQDLAYTSEEGKASSVQFVHFPFTSQQIAAFRAGQGDAVLAITHPHYGHMAVIPRIVRDELAKDFD
ncbi:MAG: DUF3501 family protein [Alphaproteobacteria bacterium]|nr:DUF3501 family protein [Alphaproteobacteria bacterium]